MTGSDPAAERRDGPPLRLPEALQRSGVVGPLLERMRDWPKLPSRSPRSLVSRLTPDVMELQVGNVFPVGIPSLIFIVFFLPFCGWVMPKDLARDLVAYVHKGSVGYSMGYAVLLLLALAVVLVTALLAYRADFQGAVGDGLTLFDRRERKVYQRVHKRIAKAEWNWDALHPYVETRNAISRVNQALTLVEFAGPGGERPSFVTVEVAGMSKEPLRDTYAFIREFMENGVAHLPPVRLVASPDPGWYTLMPSWFLGLPRPFAKSIWAFAVLLFTWPVVAWSRLLRKILPYSRWPAEIEAKMGANAREATSADTKWLAEHCQPPERPPLVARIAFIAAMLFSSPMWWSFFKAYVTKLATMA